MGHSVSPAHMDDSGNDNQKIGIMLARKTRNWCAAYDKQLKQLWPGKLADIARQMGFSQRTIQKAIDRLGLQRRKRGRIQGESFNIERDEQIRREAGAGVSQGKLMDRYSLSSRRIQQILHGNGKKE